MVRFQQFLSSSIWAGLLCLLTLNIHSSKALTASGGESTQSTTTTTAKVSMKTDVQTCIKGNLNVCNGLIDKHPGMHMLYTIRGTAHQNKGNHAAAIENFSTAISRCAKTPNKSCTPAALAETYNNRGISYFKTRNYSAAVRDYTKAISMNSKLSEAHNNRGYTYEKLKKNTEALRDYTRAIQLNPSYAGAYYNRGALYGLTLKNITKARADIAQALTLYKNKGNTERLAVTQKLEARLAKEQSAATAKKK
jgi:tetratricopeptide (TPR) repeat protein